MRFFFLFSRTSVPVRGFLILAALALGGMSRLSAGTSPIITLQPQSTNLSLGQTAVLSVAADGTAPLIYQWAQNGTNILWGTTPTITLTNASYYTVGLYTVSVSNSFGGTVSAGAQVGLSYVPVVTNGPTSVEVYWGLDANFSVGIYSLTQVGYQWYYGATLLTGQTNSNLYLKAVTKTNAGTYFVVVTNALGSISSGIATLTVDFWPAPSIRLGDPVATASELKFPVIYLANSTETNFSFSLEYDSTVLTNVALDLSPISLGTNVTVTQLPNAIGASIALPPGTVIQPGETNLGSARFSLVPGATNLFDGRIQFANVPFPLIEAPAVVNTNVTPFTTNTVVLATGLPPAFTGGSNAVALNYDTGLMEQTVEVGNPGSQFLENLFLTVAYNDTLGTVGQTNPITLANATGKLLPSGWFINEGALAPGERRWLLLQYYASDRSTKPHPALTISGYSAGVTKGPSGSLVPIGKPFTGTNGMTIQFPSQTNFHYYIQYASSLAGLTNGLQVKTSLPALSGTGSPLTWTDGSALSSGDKFRFYRVLETP